MVERVIPACAGNGAAGRAGQPARPGHPRLRGERLDKIMERGGNPGSSPPARGTVRRGCDPQRDGRVIPACAGNGFFGDHIRVMDSGHPRLRGERTRTSSPGTPCSGSSPPARGTGGRLRRAAQAHRVIPACAGNGVEGELRHGRPPGHPRLRGERFYLSGSSLENVGSSPPARGTALTGTGR